MAAIGLTSAPAFAADPPAFVIALDNFDSYANSAALSQAYARNTSGGANTVSLVDSPFGPQYGQAMQLSYSYQSGYSGRTLTVPAGYWPDLAQVDLWIQSDAAGQDVLLQFLDGASYECHLNSFNDFDPASTDPQHLSIPISAFLPKTGAGTLDTTKVTTFGIYVNQVDNGSGGVFTFDEIELGFASEPVLPQVSFSQTALDAGGHTNIISLLNAAATLPAGGKITQATYTSDNPDVLANYGRFVPKGDFQGSGSAAVALDQVKLFFAGTTFTLTVNTILNVTVADLAPAVDVIDYLNSLTGHGTVAAMHHDQSYSNPANCDSLHQRVANEFGVYPGFYSADFLTGSTVNYRQNMINEVIRQWDNGNMVQIMFHVSPPQYTVAQESQGNWGGDQAHETLPSPNRIYSFVYNDQWQELMTDGTALNTNWKLRMDEY
ncbi:MAG: hypothetical protein LBK28_08695, partial [Propionibacteriaceae bacterium]|nr:hypothetical protein [Propionibacteriaceae bacterium]